MQCGLRGSFKMWISFRVGLGHFGLAFDRKKVVDGEGGVESFRPSVLVFVFQINFSDATNLLPSRWYYSPLTTISLGRSGLK